MPGTRGLAMAKVQALMQNQPVNATYDGYTACPVLLGEPRQNWGILGKEPPKSRSENEYS